MNKLNLGGLTVPMDAVTQTFAILAKRGVGKTYLASVMAEEMLAAKQQIIAIDPTGAWWGLKSDFEVAVFGGDRGDLPLTESAGETIARAIVDGGFSAIVDLSLLRKGEMIRFMVKFVETLYRINRSALHVFVDEADAFAPQGRSGYGVEESQMLGAMEDLVRRGRKRGLGCTLITQRPAVLNKNVLTQAECLVAMRLVHPKDVDAIDEWVALHGDPKTAKAMRESLPSLAVGEAWFWSPAWGNLFERVKIRKRHTFDSGATPKPGEAAAKPKKLTPIDLAKLGERIQAAAEEAKSNDPRELKRRIAELQKKLEEKPAAVPAKVERVEVPALTPAQEKQIAKAVDDFQEASAKVVQALAEVGNVKVTVATTVPQKAHENIQGNKSHKDLQPASTPRVKPNLHGASASLPKAQRLILTALVQHGQASKAKVAVLTGYAVNGGGFNNAVSSLRSNGYLAGHGDLLIATTTGVEVLGSVDALPSGQALIEQWCRDLPKAESSILQFLCRLYPGECSKEEVASNAGYEPSGGGFNNALSKLRTLELIEGRGSLKASDSLFG